MVSGMVTGFAGLGVMGEPMALNLVRAGIPLLVWNRTPHKVRTLHSAGAEVAADLGELFDRAGTVFVMLTDEEAVDAVLGRGTDAFRTRVAGRTIVNTGTLEPAYSEKLEVDLRQAGGRYAEVPVSGSRVPAEAGELVGMMAGDPDTIADIRPLLEPLCRQLVYAGPVPNGLYMKLAVNICLITLVTGLAEAVQFAHRHGLDLDRFTEVLTAGQLASPVLKVKAPKLVSKDFAVQASIADVWMNTRLITRAAAEAGIAAPLLEVCRALYAETAGLGLDRADMTAVLTAIQARSA